MHKKNYKKYSQAFKESIVRQIGAGTPAVELARRYKLAPGLIFYWRRQANVGKLGDSPDSKIRALEREVESLKSTIGDLYRQVEAFKKSEVERTRLKNVSSFLITGDPLDQSKKLAKQ